MHHRLTEIVENLAKDGYSGAAGMTSTVLTSLLSLPDDVLTSIPCEEWGEFSVSLHRAKPTIAPVFNVTNAILLQCEKGAEAKEPLRSVLTRLLDQENGSTERIVEYALEEVRGEWLMTCSYSSTVMHVLTSLAKVRPLKVTVAESSPGREGRQFAQLLAGQGIEAEIIHDSTIIARMEVVDGAIAGADSVTAHGVVNKVGTRLMMEAAAVKGRPAYAVCGWSKLSPVVLSDPVVTTTSLGPNLTEHVQVFENTPLDLFSRIITDRGVLSSADLQMELKMERVAQAWYSRGVLKRPGRF